MSALRYPRPAVLSALRPAGELARLAVIQASAGTGKTYTIEHALVDLVLAGVALEEILVVTFTEKATAELRSRVRELLGRVLDAARGEAAPSPGPGPASAESWILDAEARERLEAALSCFERAPIRTIHGFCQGVLTENAFLLGRLLRQDLIDPREAFSAAFRAALREVYAREPLDRELEAWLASGRKVEDLETLLSKVHHKRAEVRPPLVPERLQAASEGLLGLLETPGVLEGLREACGGASFHAGTKRAIQGRFDLLEGFVQRWERPLSLLRLHLDAEIKKVTDYLLKEHVQDKLKEFGPGGLHLVVWLQRLKRHMATYEAAAAQLFLPHLRQRLAQAKVEGGGYDLDDMLAGVHASLAPGAPTRAALLGRLRGQFRHALIDEFQDTDQVQWEIFRSVFLESEGGHGLWVVGDPKQAIYGFRGGDVFTYLRAREELIEAGAVELPLQLNFRSTEALLDGLHHFFDPSSERSFFRGPQIQYDAGVHPGPPPATLVSPRGALAPIKVCRLGGSLSAASARALHGRWIAREVRRLQDEGLSLERKGAQALVGLGDVFVLTRTAREGLEVAGYLREEGVRHAFFRQEGLLQTREADDIQRLLAAIEAPWSRARRAEAWTTPFFALELAELPAAEALGSDHPLQARLLAWRELAEARAYESLFARILADTGLIRRAVFLSESERELTNYLHLFELLVSEVSRSRLDLRELTLLLRSWIDERRSPSGEAAGVQRLESDAAAVQIMTIHKAKGLEAACVFLFGGISHRKGEAVFLYHEERKRESGLSEDEARLRWRREQERRARDLREARGQEVFVYHDDQGSRVVHVGQPEGEVLAQIRREHEDEERRLIYVALTRAKGRLFLPAFTRDGGEWSYGRLGGCALHVARRLADLAEAGELPSALYEVDELSPDTAPGPPAAADLSGLSAWRPPPELLDPSDPQAESRAALRWDPAHTPRIVTSYSRLKAASHGGPEELGAEAAGAAGSDLPAGDSSQEPAPLAGAIDDGLPGGATMGSFVHEIYEHLPFASLGGDPPPAFEEWSARPEIAAIVSRAAGHYGVSSAHLPAAAALVYDSLLVPVELPTGPLPGGLRSVASPLAEPEFVYPLPNPGAQALALPALGERLVVSRGYVRGFIDFLFRDPRCGRAYFLDWKTDRLSDFAGGAQGPVATHVKLHYQVQLQLYSLALVRWLRIEDEGAYEERFGGAVYAFVRGMRPGLPPGSGLYALRPTWAELQAWEAELANLEVLT